MSTRRLFPSLARRVAALEGVVRKRLATVLVGASLAKGST